ncbi:uncharacterized protein KGF55_004543 [Candida pseudojiufengensis]|uniref:uncharacterized protein n=1 Tax=Candida pseudojiufengensis TaxID=497109 RepID=UPI002224CD05|nr:uncharacterized protein KGF55_004543 [Candida pseudojiufengensis]KAI5960650.1 hypothetical protein KGF55_004543 [Candida pseudojiufengensis]
MSSITDLKINRCDVALSRNDPIQISDNLQITINSFNELHIIEPKFPTYHNSIVQTQTTKTLKSKEIFSFGSLLHTEAIKNLPVNKFQDVIFKDGDEPLNFIVQDPNVVEYQWSPLLENTRDCLCGVLFNTGELLIMGRKLHGQLYNYEVKVNVFDTLIKSYDDIIEHEGKYYVTAERFKNLKIKYFTFNLVEGKLNLAIVDITNKIIIFNDQMIVSKEVEFPKNIAKIKWEKDVFLIIGYDNSFSVLNLDTGSFDEIYPANRFVNKKNELVTINGKVYLISTFLSKLVVFDGDEKVEYDTGTWSYNTSIIPAIKGNALIILLSFEDGTFKTFYYNINSKKLSLESNDIAFYLFSEKAISFSQSNDEGYTETTEGTVILYGMTAITNNVIAIIYKVIPKNGIHLRPPSTAYVNVSFVKLSSSIGEIKNTSIANTSISKLTAYYLDHFENIPIIMDDFSVLQEQKLEFFLTEFGEFVNRVIKPIPRLNEVTIDPGSSFDEIISENFINLKEIIELQFFQTFCLLLQSALKNYTSADTTAKVLYHQIDEYKSDVEKTIANYLKDLILQIYNEKSITDEIDKYLLITLAYQTPTSEAYELPSNAHFTIKTKNLEETFDIGLIPSINQSQLQDKMITSKSNHGWSICNLTNYPLIRMNNKLDESDQFRYISLNTEFKHLSENDAVIMKEVVNCIGFCYISGNRIYDIN